MSTLLEVEDVRHSYGDAPSLDGIRFTAEEGEIVAVVGPNGAGKSTLLSVIAGLLRVQSGGVTLKPKPLASKRQPTRNVAYAPQDTALFLGATGMENLRFFGRLADRSRRSDLELSIEHVTQRLRCDHLLDRPVFALSGGERRRIHIAVALLAGSPLVLLDEPTSSVDVETRSAVVDLVRELASAGSCVLYSTHDFAEVEALDARVAILDKGRIIADDSLHALRREHGSAWAEVTVAGPAPDFTAEYPTVVAGSTIRSLADDPAHRLQQLLADVTATGARVTDLGVTAPGLPSLFLTLTGRQFDATENGGIGSA